MKIAADIASADNPIEELVGGCLLALEEHKTLEVIAVGNQRRIEDALAQSKKSYDKRRLSIEHTDEIIEMHESPSTGVKQKKNSSVMIAARLVGEGIAEGFFSPGNTGATLAASLMEIGRLKGVLRPAIASPLPDDNGGLFYLLDAGANVDCSPEYLTQFAIMGEALSRYYRGVPRPRVGLLNVGEEESKGDSLTKKTYERISKIPFNFIGNIEPSKMYKGTVDIVVCDGFVGNMVLKTSEGISRSLIDIMKRAINKDIMAKMGAVMMRSVFKALRKIFSADTYGAAPLVGVNGAVLIGHGHSSENAVKNGVLGCAHFAEQRVAEHILEHLKRYGHSRSGFHF